MTIATPLGFGIAASLATLAGGLLALRLAGRVVLILGLTAGVVLGVALFDLIPEALALAAPMYATIATFAWVAVGLGGYMAFERLLGPRQARWALACPSGTGDADPAQPPRRSGDRHRLPGVAADRRRGRAGGADP